MSRSLSTTAGSVAKSGPIGRFGGLRRRLFLLTGLGAAAVAKAVIDAPTPTHAAGFVVGAPPGYTPIDPPSDGVQGYAVGANAAGTFGRNNDLNGVGVHGVAPSGVGSYGESTTGTGVGGVSASGFGLRATSASNAAAYVSSTSSYGMFATSGTGVGVVGQTTSGSEAVYGSASGGTGVRGDSATGMAVVGVASGSATTSVGGYFFASNPGAYALRTSGRALITGDFTVTGLKSAAVPGRDGSLRRVYCLEAPESFFEDVGRDQIVGGRGAVQLDPEFRAIVRGDDYLVSLTPLGDCNGLYVADLKTDGFEVRELRGGTSSVPFHYRITAKRKDVPDGRRLERVEEPAPIVPIRNVPAINLPAEDTAPVIDAR